MLSNELLEKGKKDAKNYEEYFNKYNQELQELHGKEYDLLDTDVRNIPRNVAHLILARRVHMKEHELKREDYGITIIQSGVNF